MKKNLHSLFRIITFKTTLKKKTPVNNIPCKVIPAISVQVKDTRYEVPRNETEMRDIEMNNIAAVVLRRVGTTNLDCSLCGSNDF